MQTNNAPCYKGIGISAESPAAVKEILLVSFCAVIAQLSDIAKRIVGVIRVELVTNIANRTTANML